MAEDNKEYMFQYQANISVSGVKDVHEADDLLEKMRDNVEFEFPIAVYVTKYLGKEPI